MAETRKAKDRREREGFFDKYCQGRGIDIGGGHDPLNDSIEIWDLERGDATFMKGVPDDTYDFVYSSHCLEHISNPFLALLNWCRILKKGGYLIIAVPHRDLYEKKKFLPSRWNGDHKFFFLPDDHDLPHTIGLTKLIRGSIGNQIGFISVRTCDEGHTITDPNQHSNGEYAIEVILVKD